MVPCAALTNEIHFLEEFHMSQWLPLERVRMVSMGEGWKARIEKVRGVYVVSIPMNVLWHGHGSTKRGGSHSKLRHAPGQYGSIGTYNPESRRIHVWSPVGTRGKGYEKWVLIEAAIGYAGIASPTEIVGGPPSSRDPSSKRLRTPKRLAPALRAKVSKKIQLLRREGYKAKQAAAIAYRKVLSSKKRRRDPDETHEEKLARWERQEHAERSRYPRHPTRHHQRQRVHLTVERVRLDRGGYEKSGRYWGTGEPLYRVSGELRTGERLYFIDLHVRARSAQEARAKVAEEERVVGVSRAAHARASRDPKRGRHRKGAYRRGR